MESISESSQQQKRKAVTHGLEDQKRNRVLHSKLSMEELTLSGLPALISSTLTVCSLAEPLDHLIKSSLLSLASLDARKGVECSAIGVADSYELSSRCWELNPGPLQEQPVLLTSEPPC
ncbi:neuron navigator 2 isoform 2 [Cricetulus griseus]|uniref:Neuron navigator 2 isoform 2 n=1 Tax=Cricetulus griseus TaxID=10029 RepID=A0A061I9U3_CRIGR|nr:neuron navigator 2 isoform 2 [Cricetulus griseus]